MYLVYQRIQIRLLMRCFIAFQFVLIFRIDILYRFKVDLNQFGTRSEVLHRLELSDNYVGGRLQFMKWRLFAISGKHNQV